VNDTPDPFSNQYIREGNALVSAIARQAEAAKGRIDLETKSNAASQIEGLIIQQ
jgi:hypothetical protein